MASKGPTGKIVRTQYHGNGLAELALDNGATHLMNIMLPFESLTAFMAVGSETVHSKLAHVPPGGYAPRRKTTKVARHAIRL